MIHHIRHAGYIPGIPYGEFLFFFTGDRTVHYYHTLRVARQGDAAMLDDGNDNPTTETLITMDLDMLGHFSE